MKILIAIDLLYKTEPIVSQAKRIAKAFTAEIWLLHVAVPDPDFIDYSAGPQPERNLMAEELHREHKQIQAIAAEFRELGITATALLVQGATIETILTKASQLSVDLIFMGSHGRGTISHIFVGSTSQAVLRQATCPVLIIPSRNS